MPVQHKLQRRLRVAGGLAGIGLLVQLVTLFGSHATAFLAFATIGLPLVLAGCLVFLFSLVSRAEE